MKRFKELCEEILNEDKYPSKPYIGLVIKVVPYDKDNGKFDELYDHWIAISKVSGDKFDGFTENGGLIKGLSFKNNVKRPIGDIENDFANLGKKRHEDEVVSFINKYVKSPKTM